MTAGAGALGLTAGVVGLLAVLVLTRRLAADSALVLLIVWLYVLILVVYFTGGVAWH